MNKSKKEFYDRHGKELECAYCDMLNDCIQSKQPLRISCERIYYKDRCEVLEKALELALYDAYDYEQEYYIYEIPTRDEFIEHNFKRQIKRAEKELIKKAEKELKGERNE